MQKGSRGSKKFCISHRAESFKICGKRVGTLESTMIITEALKHLKRWDFSCLPRAMVVNRQSGQILSDNYTPTLVSNNLFWVIQLLLLLNYFLDNLYNVIIFVSNMLLLYILRSLIM